MDALMYELLHWTRPEVLAGGNLAFLQPKKLKKAKINLYSKFSI